MIARKGTIGAATGIAVGDDAEVRALAGPRTRAVNLRGRLALPAFGDSHIHAISGGLESLRCNMLGLKTRQQCLDTIAAYSATLAPAIDEPTANWMFAWNESLL